jgi:hypothetical protein
MALSRARGRYARMRVQEGIQVDYVMYAYLMRYVGIATLRNRLLLPTDTVLTLGCGGEGR